MSVFSVRYKKLRICFKLTRVFKSCQSEGLSCDRTTATVLGPILRTLLRLYLGVNLKESTATVWGPR